MVDRIFFDPVTEQIQFDGIGDSTIHKVAFDLKTVNDSKWKLRFRLNITNRSNPTTNEQRIFIGLSTADENIGASVAQDAIYLDIRNAPASVQSLALRVANGVGLSSGADNIIFTDDPDPKVLYVEIERTSFTVGDESIIARVFDNPSFAGTPVEEVFIQLIDATLIENLRYFFVTSFDTLTTTGGSLDGFVTDVEFWNNTYNPLNKVQTFVDHFDDSSLYTQVSTTVTVDDPSFPKQIKFNNTPEAASDRRVFRTLPFALDDEKWVVEYDFDPTASGGVGAAHKIVQLNQKIGDMIGTDESAITMDYSTAFGAGLGIYVAYKASGTADPVTGASDSKIFVPVGTKVYVRVTRVGRAEIRHEVFLDPERTVPIAGSPTFVTPVSGGANGDLVDVKNLHIFQSGNSSVGGFRFFTGTVHNLKIYNGVNTVDADTTLTKAETFDEYETQAEADDAWPSANVAFSRVTIANDNLEFNSPLNGLNTAIWHDFQKEIGKGNFLDDNAWLLRFKIRWSTLNFVATAVNHTFGITQENGIDTDFDGLDTFMEMIYNHANVGNSALGIRSAVQALHFSTLDEQVVRQLAVATDYYFEIARTSKTTGYMRFFESDPTFKNIVEQFNFTNVSEALGGLRYFKFTNRIVNVSGGANGILDDVFLWNGTCIPNDSDKIRVRLDECFQPESIAGNKIKWTAKKSGNTNRIKAQVWEGSSLRVESPFFELTDGYRDFEYEMTAVEFASIGDWNGLSIVLVPDTVE